MTALERFQADQAAARELARKALEDGAYVHGVVAGLLQASPDGMDPRIKHGSSTQAALVDYQVFLGRILLDGIREALQSEGALA